MMQNKKSIIIFIDENVVEETYNKFFEKLDYLGYSNFNKFTEINNSINYIKKEISFEDTKIIVNGQLYKDFKKIFKKEIKNIFVIPKIIIFTNDKKKFMENNKKYKEDNSFFNFGGIMTSFDQIETFLSNNFKGKKFEIEDEPQLTFEYIDKKEKLALQLFYKVLIEFTDIDGQKLQKFNEDLYKEYSNNKDLEEIFSQIIKMKDIPIELLARYYAKAYTFETPFYKNMNRDLRNNEKEKYLPYVKVFYESIKYETFPLVEEKLLYRGTKILSEEIQKINIYLNSNKIDNLPGYTVFSIGLFDPFPKMKKS
jgi:hypothetical protein